MHTVVSAAPANRQTELFKYAAPLCMLHRRRAIARQFAEQARRLCGTCATPAECSLDRTRGQLCHPQPQNKAPTAHPSHKPGSRTKAIFTRCRVLIDGGFYEEKRIARAFTDRELEVSQRTQVGQRENQHENRT